MNLAGIQRLIPARMKFSLKPYYRRVFGNRLHVLFWPTFRCNYRCSYCTVYTKFNFTKVYAPNAEVKVDQPSEEASAARNCQQHLAAS
jgi:wyosine [tRNA(Phe)-imidazoG37] synthetase (radical SAM superfamily)